MNAPTCTVESCSRPVPDNAYVCPRCAHLLDRALGDVTSLLEELAVTRARLSRAGKQLGPSSGERALPYDVNAAEAHEVLTNTLTTWARLVLEERGGTIAASDREPGDVAAGYLLGSVEWLRHHEAGPEAVDEIAAAVRQAERAIDTGIERIFADVCGVDGCPEALYAHLGRDRVRCRACGTVHEVAPRREAMLGQVSKMLLPAHQVADACAVLGSPVTPDRVRQWATRGRLIDKGPDRQGRPTYAVCEALELAEQHAARTAQTRRGTQDRGVA